MVCNHATRDTYLDAMESEYFKGFVRAETGNLKRTLDVTEKHIFENFSARGRSRPGQM